MLFLCDLLAACHVNVHYHCKQHAGGLEGNLFCENHTNLSQIVKYTRMLTGPRYRYIIYVQYVAPNLIKYYRLRTIDPMLS
jgi:hypothetical protein